MKRTLRMFVLLIVSVVGIFCTTVASETQSNDTLAAFIQEIQEASNRVTSFRCEFSQEKRLSMFNGPVNFEGELVVVRPDKLRWEFRSPVPSVLIFNGTRGVRCSDQAKPVRFQLENDPVMRAVADQLRLWLGGDYRNLESNYTLLKQEPATLVVKPQNPSEEKYISLIKIFFDEESLQPHRVEISEPGGDQTIIAFQRPIINSYLPDSLFNECELDE